ATFAGIMPPDAETYASFSFERMSFPLRTATPTVWAVLSMPIATRSYWADVFCVLSCFIIVLLVYDLLYVFPVVAIKVRGRDYVRVGLEPLVVLLIALPCGCLKDL